MEEAQYWMWARKKQPIDHQLDLFNSPPIALRLTPMSSAMIDSRSWEEKAFAEDSAGILGGGCIWPPRSYPCSFCGRDFRSAQALGGHMNVHRRDRARLKQSSIVEEEDEAEDLVINPSLIPNFGNFEAAPNYGEEMRLGEMGFIRLMKRDFDEEENEIKGSCKKKKKKNSMSPADIVEELDLELRLGDLPKVK
ncbi:hypothetical protein IEQ34_002187 [Dendrobium chrysotoxum]|uniref:C2H2-type domain-containing protein n=1 Tax=Dendrobium chrysotoxum TaxID=161865 RepID=A0AAV7HLD5_DENCH|nr:hypothetical protein IEQ34_002187 [Dendrobium chrysotoxum]